MKIFYAAQISNFTIKDGEQKFILSTDACMNLCVGIISNILDRKSNYKFLIAVPDINLVADYTDYYDLFERKYHNNLQFIQYCSPIGPVDTRFHFDFLFLKEMGREFKDVNVMINDQNTLTKNWNALFYALGLLNIPIVSTNYYLDSPLSSKVPSKITYFERMMESLNNSNLTAFQCEASKKEALDAYNYFYRSQTLRGASTTWNTGVWVKEIEKHKTTNRYAVPVIYFGNRISDSANRYNNYHTFAEAVGILFRKYKPTKVFNCIMLNPTKKVTDAQLQLIAKLSNGNVIVHENDKSWTREDYIRFINAAHISCNLFTNEVHGGVTHAEAMAAGNIVIMPRINNYAFKFRGISEDKYPFFCRLKRDKQLDAESIADKMNLALETIYNGQFKSYSLLCKKLAYQFESYENASIKIIKDLNSLVKGK